MARMSDPSLGWMTWPCACMARCNCWPTKPVPNDSHQEAHFGGVLVRVHAWPGRGREHLQRRKAQ
eukprot:15349373-Alexandrium_andersonii.AAC.1